MPYARDLERAAIPSVDDIVGSALRLVGKKAPAGVR
jgi:hypothetical protein